jgi:hypothetical protein
MKAANVVNNTRPLHTAARRLVCLLLVVVLGGCQWLQQKTGMPSLWPWQQEEPQSDPTEFARQQKVAELVAKGQLAFTKDRLSIPPNDNAILYFNEALVLDPTSQEARRGLNQVAGRFRKLARMAHGNGDEKHAQKYLQQAEAITGAKQPANRKLREELQATPAGQNQQSLDHGLREQYEANKQSFDKKQLLDKRRTIIESGDESPAKTKE